MGVNKNIDKYNIKFKQRKKLMFINKMDKVKFGFFNPATETFLVVENTHEFRLLMERLSMQKREREEE